MICDIVSHEYIWYIKSDILNYQKVNFFSYEFFQDLTCLISTQKKNNNKINSLCQHFSSTSPTLFIHVGKGHMTTLS